jgi:hypothetical protein
MVPPAWALPPDDDEDEDEPPGFFALLLQAASTEAGATARPAPAARPLSTERRLGGVTG